MAPFTRMAQPMSTKGFAQSELQKQVEAAGFTDVKFSTAYTIKKKIGDEEKILPCLSYVRTSKIIKEISMAEKQKDSPNINKNIHPPFVALFYIVVTMVLQRVYHHSI
jgi:hypothetical protein